MARALTRGDRRQARRLIPEATPWKRNALLRPGQEVRVANLSPGGALVESQSRLLPGAMAELQLTGRDRLTVRGRIDRCRVIGLQPLRYEGAIVFEQRLEWTKG